VASIDFEITVDAKPEQVLREFVLVLSANPRVTVMQPVNGVLVVDEKYVPAVQIVLAILLFPIGLVLLLIRRKRSATVTVDQTEHGTEIAISGSVSRRITDGLYGVTGMLVEIESEGDRPLDA
jgi:hypothetical protein